MAGLLSQVRYSFPPQDSLGPPEIVTATRQKEHSGARKLPRNFVASVRGASTLSREHG